MYNILLQRRAFRLLWLAEIFATIGTQLYSIGVLVVVFTETGSTLQAALVLVARTLPRFLLGPFAGALVDRYPRRRVLVAMNVVRALLIGISFYFAQDPAAHLWAIYAIVVGLTAADTFHKPAELALIPSLVNKDELVQANSLVMSTTQASIGVAYALGGILILRVGLSATLVVDLACFLLAALLVLAMHDVEKAKSSEQQSGQTPLFRSIADGLGYLRRHDLARSLVTMEFLENWPHGIWTAPLMLAFTEQALQAGPDVWGFQNATYFAGHLVGATFAVIFATRLARRPGWAIVANAFIMAVLTATYALSSNLAVIIVVCFVFGLPMAFRDIAQDTLLQARVDGKLLGRVYATRQMMASLAFMIAGLAFAALADVVPVRSIYLTGAALYLGTALYALSRRSIRRSRLLEPGRSQPQPVVRSEELAQIESLP